jgi:hypothetical protein
MHLHFSCVLGQQRRHRRRRIGCGGGSIQEMVVAGVDRHRKGQRCIAGPIRVGIGRGERVRTVPGIGLGEAPVAGRVDRRRAQVGGAIIDRYRATRFRRARQIDRMRAINAVAGGRERGDEEQVEETSAAVAAGVRRWNHCPLARCCPGSNRMDLAGSRDSNWHRRRR